MNGSPQTLPSPACGEHRPPARDALDAAIRLLDAAEARQRPVDMVRALAQVGHGYRALEEHGAAERYLQQALRWARTLGGVDASVDLLCDLSELAVTAATDPARERAEARAARDRARDHGFEAASLARQCADPAWEVTVLLRVSDVLDRCGDHDDAVALQCRAIDLIARSQLTSLPEPRAAAPSTTM
jgi:hypothetical protein